MNYYNRYFSSFWGIFSLLSVAFWLLLQRRFELSTWLEYTEGMLLLYLIYNSRSLRYKYNRSLWMAVGILGLGLIFRTLRLPYSFILQIFGSSAIIIAYLLFYIRYTRKSTLDSFKLGWILVFLSERMLSLMHFPIPLVLKNISSLLIFTVYFWVAKLELSGRDQSEIEELQEELPEDIL